MPAIRRSPKDQVESQTLKQEAVTFKLPWTLKNVKDARAMGYMLRKAAKREWNQPRRKQFVAVNQDEKGVGIWRPLWCQPWRCRVWNLPSWFPVFLWELQLSDWMNLGRDLEFELLLLYTMRTLKGGLKAFGIMLCWSIPPAPPPPNSSVWTSLWGPGSGMWYEMTTYSFYLLCWLRCLLPKLIITWWW